MYLPEPNPSFLFLRFAICHWHAKSRHLRFSTRYWRKTSLLVLCLKSKTHSMALNMILLSFTSKHNCHGTISQSQFSPPMEITTCFVKLTLHRWPQLYDFVISQHQQARRLVFHKSIPAFYFPYFLCPRIPSRHQKRSFTAGGGECQVIHQASSTNLFQKRAGLTLRALHFKARCLTLDFWIDGLILRLSAYQFPISR